MKTRLLLLPVALVVLSSCSPQIYSFSLELRKPTPAGVDFYGKSLAIAYQDSPESRDTAFCNAFATGLAQAVEKEYFGSEQVVDIFRLPYDEQADYSHPDSLVSMVLGFDKDVVMYLKPPMISETSMCERFVVYDSMDKEEKVRNIKKYGTLPDYVSNPSGFVDGSILLGYQTGVAFEPQWEPYNLFVYFYERYGGWYDGIDAVMKSDFRTAIDCWLPLVQKGSDEERSCAAYNIGLACFLLEDTALAEEWLDKSEALYPNPLVAEARKAIASHSSGTH